VLNWLLRYAPVVTALARGDGGRSVSILDVGCGPQGLACALPNLPFVGFDIAFETPPPLTMVPVRSPPGRLPFLDRAFDVVVCLDVLEHIPPQARENFVAELGRVSAKRVLLACPSDEAAWADDYLRADYERRGVSAPPWLDEHGEHGLPSVADLESLCSHQPGFAHRPWQMVNELLSMLIPLGDVTPEFAPLAAEEWRRNGGSWLRVFQAAEFGNSSRKGYVLERQVPSRARVAPESLLAGMLSALSCGSCGATHRLLDDGRAMCLGCGRMLAADNLGVWGLGPQSA
jgi:SAM-dependent methyltransferase